MTQTMKPRFGTEMYSILVDVLKGDPQMIPTFIQVNDSLSQPLRERLLQSVQYTRPFLLSTQQAGNEEARDEGQPSILLDRRQTDTGNFDPTQNMHQ